MNQSVAPHEVLKCLQANSKTRILDVRSEGEFEKGQIPFSRNIPILSNEHRHLVGTAYKQEGNEQAVALGHRLVSPFREGMVRQWIEALQDRPAGERIVTCWRGGLRSKIACEWLEAEGVEVLQVEGGFKALRNELLKQYQHIPPLLLVGGFTGGGKTTLLRGLAPEFVIDLEKLADHRGSIFGRFIDRRQPAQITFENSVGLKFFERTAPLVCEAESRMVGHCAIPDSLKAAMDAAPMVLLNEPLQSRAKNIFEEYVFETFHQSPTPERWLQIHDHFQSCLVSIQRRLGGAATKEISTMLTEAFTGTVCDFDTHSRWISALLEKYYDRLYAHSLLVNQRNVTFEGNWKECHDFITTRIDWWRA